MDVYGIVFASYDPSCRLFMLLEEQSLQKDVELHIIMVVNMFLMHMIQNSSYSLAFTHI